MVLLVVDTQKAITNADLFNFDIFENNVKKLIVAGLQTDYCIDATVKCGFEHGFKMIVTEYANSTFDNTFMSAEASYKYYNEFMWKGRYAECISLDETLERMKK